MAAVVRVPGAHPAPQSPSPAHRRWLANIDRRTIAPRVVADLVRGQCITRDSFRALDAMEQITDPDGKSYFVISRGTRGSEISRAVLLSYLLNAGTGYGQPGVRGDFPATPYGDAEARRIIARQRANRWSYTAVRLIDKIGGCLVTTPNGVLMGLGGRRVHPDAGGGTMWGEVFMINAGHVGDPAQRLREIIESGRLPGGLDLDRVLHHEEIHARQWAALGPIQMPVRYLAEEARSRILGASNSFEKAAGLSDGGYR